MKWKILIILTLLILTQVVTAQEICTEYINPNQECLLTTPSITCTNYTYDIINTNGTIVETQNLTNLNQSVYYITINLSRGDYVVRLCEGTTQEIHVRGEENNMYLAMISGLIIIVWLFVTLSNNLNNSEYIKYLRSALYLLAYAFVVLLFNISRLIAIDLGASSNIINMFGTGWTIIIMISVGIAGGLLVYTAYKVIKLYIDGTRGFK